MMQEDEPNWEKFDIGYRGPRKSYAHVSINKRGKLQLNTFLMESLGFPEAVSLYYDRSRSWIGIKPGKIADPDTLRVSLRDGRRYGEVYALSFLRSHAIKINRTLAASHITTAPDGTLVVDLEKCERSVERKRTLSPKDQRQSALDLLQNNAP